MPAPTFTLPILGSPPDLIATAEGLEAETNRVIQDLWAAAIAGDLSEAEAEALATQIAEDRDAAEAAAAAAEGWAAQSAAGRAVYVNSVTGSNANTGLAPNVPLQTLSAVSGVLGGDFTGATIWLARGSYWREEIAASAPGVSVRGYGSGPLPVVDARDIISAGGWEKTAGYTNVYQVNWTPTASTQVAPSLWESGVRMTRVASIAACDAAPGSYFAANSYTSGVPAPIYMHPTASDNPGTSGTQYQQAVRARCVHLEGVNSAASDIRCIGNQHDNGCIELGRFGTMERVIAQDGTKHNAFLRSGVARDCVAYLFDPTFVVFQNTTLIPFVGYNTASARDPMKWERCIVIGSKTQAAVSNASGFYAHAQAGQTSFSVVEVLDCETYQMAHAVLGAAQAERLLVMGHVAYNTGRLIGDTTVPATLPGGVDVLGCEWVVDRDMTEISFRGIWRPNSASDRGRVSIRDTVGVLLGGAVGRLAQDPINWSPGGSAGDLTLERVALLQRPISTTQQTCTAIKLQGTTGTLALTVRNCLVDGWGSFQSSGARGFHLDVRAGVTSLTLENNVFNGMDGATERGAVRRGDTTYDTATAYLTAVQPGENPGSVSVAVTQVAGNLLRRDYFVDLDARTKDCVPRIEVKGVGEPLADRWRRLCDEVEAA